MDTKPLINIGLHGTRSTEIIPAKQYIQGTSSCSIYSNSSVEVLESVQ